jgi:REP element-mobilizing transposase RayT
MINHVHLLVSSRFKDSIAKTLQLDGIMYNILIIHIPDYPKASAI